MNAALVALPDAPDLESALRALLERIPPGHLTTFGRLAHALGSRSAAIWVAQYTVRHRPAGWHRIVRADRSVSAPEQLPLLARELPPGSAPDLSRMPLWDPVADGRLQEAPLARLAAFQEQAARLVVAEDCDGGGDPDLVGGLDVSYGAPSADGTTVAVAGLALVRRATRTPVVELTVERPVSFPYIQGLLAFRELPVLLGALECARMRGLPEPSAWVVDGSGILHPRGAGIASQLGVVAGLRTIGVTKSRLAGTPLPPTNKDATDGDARIVVDGALRGWRLNRGRRTLYVSPGHRTSPETARRLVQDLSEPDVLLPIPLHLADRSSRRHARSGTPTRARSPDAANRDRSR